MEYMGEMVEVPVGVLAEGTYFIYEGHGHFVTHSRTINRAGEESTYARGACGYCEDMLPQTTVLVDYQKSGMIDC